MNKEEIEQRYNYLCNEPSDINLHLPKLREYADQCLHVTEFGVRSAVSLFAFLSSNANKIVAYDIVEGYRPPEIEKLTFICADVLKTEIEPTDLLFIDTAHNYNQLRQELALHANKAQKFLAFHDTYTFGENGDDGGKGLTWAINEFLLSHPQWRVDYHTNKCNGLTILKR